MKITHGCQAGGWPCGKVREEAHWTANGLVCVDPVLAVRADGTPRFEMVIRPDWSPPFAWREHRPGREPWTGPQTRAGVSGTGAEREGR